VSPQAAAVTAALMVELQPEVPPGLTQKVAAEAMGDKASSEDAMSVQRKTRCFNFLSPCVEKQERMQEWPEEDNTRISLEVAPRGR